MAEERKIPATAENRTRNFVAYRCQIEGSKNVMSFFCTQERALCCFVPLLYPRFLLWGAVRFYQD